jgi:hypothetical protein
MTGRRNQDRDEPVKIPLDPETALRALLAVDPDEDPDEESADDKTDDAERAPGQEDDRQRGSRSG